MLAEARKACLSVAATALRADLLYRKKQEGHHLQRLDSSLVDCIAGPRGELKANLDGFQARLQVIPKPHRLHQPVPTSAWHLLSEHHLPGAIHNLIIIIN